jgi:hypothetical protein
MKKIKYLSLLFILTSSTISCTTTFEVVMPYRNLGGYSGARLFPIKTNEAEYTFRAWISNSTSIDRIISISKDSGQNYTGTLIEFGKKVNGKKHVNFYNEISITPTSGFENLRKALDSLKIQTMTNQPCCIPVPFDAPFSTYVIEIKNKSQYNCFRFDTNYPLKTEKPDIYSTIEKLLFNEFNLHKYFKFEQNGSLH